MSKLKEFKLKLIDLKDENINKDLLEYPIFKKKKNGWILLDKRKLITNIEYKKTKLKRKDKIKNVDNIITNVSNNYEHISNLVNMVGGNDIYNEIYIN